LGNQQHLYEFGRLLGLAFQVQDDYLDAFGDPAKFGKQVGGDIVAGKKTFLLIKAFETATAAQQKEIRDLERAAPAAKIAGMLDLFRACGVDAWARELKEKYVRSAHQHLEDIAVLSRRKQSYTDAILEAVVAGNLESVLDEHLWVADKLNADAIERFPRDLPKVLGLIEGRHRVHEPGHDEDQFDRDVRRTAPDLRQRRVDRGGQSHDRHPACDELPAGDQDRSDQGEVRSKR